MAIFDPHCNPTRDLQAADRARRLGQVRDVEVSRFIAADTVEEMIHARQIHKSQQVESILSAELPESRPFDGVECVSGREGELFGHNNLLFDYQAERGILQRILQSSDVMEISGIHVSGPMHVKEDQYGDVTDREEENDLSHALAALVES